MSQLSERIKQTKFEGAGQEAMLSIMIASSYLRERLNTICTRQGISLQQFNILRILKGAYPNGYPRSEISHRMVERAPDTTRLVDRLVKAGFVRREKSPDDLRQSIAKITDPGIKLLIRLSEEIKNFHENLEEKLTKETCQDISNGCEEILKLK